MVVNASQIDEGLITARVRTWNLLYAARGLAPAPPFGEARVVELATVWEWHGAAWGGPVPEGEYGSGESPPRVQKSH